MLRECHQYRLVWVELLIGSWSHGDRDERDAPSGMTSLRKQEGGSEGSNHSFSWDIDAGNLRLVVLSSTKATWINYQLL